MTDTERLEKLATVLRSIRLSLSETAPELVYGLECADASKKNEMYDLFDEAYNKLTRAVLVTSAMNAQAKKLEQTAI